MADYSTLQAGYELDRFIAARLGYRVQKQRSGYYALFSPSGNRSEGKFIDERMAWQSLPHYSTDANAAITLETEYVRITLTPLGYWQVSFDLGNVVHGYADTMPLAYCRAWLAFQDTAEREADDGQA